MVPALRRRLLLSLSCAVAIVAAGSTLGLLANAVSSAGIPLIAKAPAPGREIGLASARQVHEDDGAVFIDARTRAEYAAGHIKGALSVPFAQRADELDELRRELPRSRPLVVYCDGGPCASAPALSAWLGSNGWRDVRVLSDGFPVWAAAGFPVTSGAAP